jgi:hypothetical protein
MANEIRLQRLGLIHQRDRAQPHSEFGGIKGHADGQLPHRGQAVQIKCRQLPQARDLFVLDAGGVEFIRLRLGQPHGDVIEQNQAHLRIEQRQHQVSSAAIPLHGRPGVETDERNSLTRPRRSQQALAVRSLASTSQPKNAASNWKASTMKVGHPGRAISGAWIAGRKTFRWGRRCGHQRQELPGPLPAWMQRIAMKRNRQRVHAVPKGRRFVAAQTIADSDKASAQAHLLDNPRMNGSAFGLGRNRTFCLRMAHGSGRPGVSRANSRLRWRAIQ